MSKTKLILIVAVMAAGCGGKQKPATDGDALGGGETRSETSDSTEVVDRPTGNTLGHPCSGDGDCAAGQNCAPPEAEIFDLCVVPAAKKMCGEGMVEDKCANCFQACTSDADCASAGKTCNGEYCIGATTCHILK